MAHKVHPKSYRIKNIADWDSRGFYKNPAESLEEDFKIRSFLKSKIGKLGVEKIEIERFANKTNIIIHSARPGLIIGRRGEGVEQLKKILQEKIKKDKKKEMRIEIREIKNPWMSANLVAQWIAQQLEKRMPYRRVLKQALSKASYYKEILGIKVEVSGRLNGTEIARREWLKAGRLPLQTIRSDIDYARYEALCSYGLIGVKVWIYKGEKFD